MKRLLAPSILFVFLYLNLSAQIPASSVYLIQPQDWKSDSIRYSNPIFLTNFNPEGYNNHPFFADENRLIISSKSLQQVQPDLIELHLAEGTLKKLTQTVSGEYAVSRIPNSDDYSFIRQENYPDDTLIRIWNFPSDPKIESIPLFPHLTNTGYHCWLDDQKIVLFLVENTHRLVIADQSGTILKTITQYPGRCFKLLPNGNLIYQSNLPEEGPLLKIYNPKDDSNLVLTQPVGESQDFEIVEGQIIMAKMKKLYTLNWSNPQPLWHELGSFDYLPGHKISRLAISKSGKLAFVVE